MMNKREILIKTLHGKLHSFSEIEQLLQGQDIYTETGHVDCEFLTALLEFMAEMVHTSNQVQLALHRMLGIEDEQPKNKKEDSGKQWKAEDILKHCTLENNVLKLPNVQFNKKSYSEAKKWIEEAGGSWTGGKIQGFTFPFNPERVFSILNQGKRCNLQQEYQFFETPPEVADWLVMIAGGIDENDTVLEPSAGRGAIINAIHRNCPSVTVDCYELMPENKELLKNLGNIRLMGDDFTKECSGTYSKIIANPPFSGNQDIDHVMLMYEHLDDSGTLAAITSQHWKIASEKKCVDFRKWLEDIDAKTFDINSGEFKESGTSIATSAIVIHKKVTTKGKQMELKFNT